PSASGTVTDRTGLALPGVVVTVKATTAVAVSDERGRFAIETTGAAPVLVFALSGFQTRELPLKSGASRSDLHVVLELAAISNEVIVRAPATVNEPDARLVLRPIDVVRTAGAQADLMRALAVLPGVATIDEGAGLFVRGGDVSET